MKNILRTFKPSSIIQIICLLIFIGFNYLPLIINGGIIVDDWGDISHNLNCLNFLHCYQTWFPLFSNRPLAPVPIVSATLLFKTHFSWYLILNSGIYLAAIFLTARVLNKLIGLQPSLVFCFFAAIPFIAMPILASPINQLTATVSILCWAVSLEFIVKSTQSNRAINCLISTLFLLLGFLTYEIILPLLTLTVLLPYVVDKKIFFRRPLTYFLIYTAPIILVLLITYIWQKELAPHFMDVDSRLKLNIMQAIPKLHTWIQVFYKQIPSLFIKSFYYLTPFQLITGAILAIGILYKGQSLNAFPEKKLQFRFFIVSLLTFLSTSLIFILSNESATSWGYQARGLSSTWYALSILLACLISLNTPYKWCITGLIILFGIFSSISFSIQRDNYISSWELQNKILSDVINKIHLSSIEKNSVIIGNVPKFTAQNYNDEIVFSQPWDFGAALSIFTKNKISDGAVIDTRSNDLRHINISPGYVSIDNWWKASYFKLWFYDYDPSNHQGSLVRINDAKELKDILESFVKQK